MHELLKPLDELRPLHDPVLIAAFAGFSDFGGAARATLDHLAASWESRPLAEIPAEELFDFTVQRPTVRLEGERRVIDWPTTTFQVASPPGADRDIVLLGGNEPHLRWRGFTEAIADLMEVVGAKTSVTIAAQAASVPHTRPLPVTLSASHGDFEQQFGLEVPSSRYEGPTGIVGVFNVDQRRRGLRNASLWAQAPHYLSAGPNPHAMLALIRVLDRGYGTSTSTAAVEELASNFDQQVEEALREEQDAARYVQSLEEQYDEESSTGPATPSGGELPTADELLSDLEGFLREQQSGDDAD